MPKIAVLSDALINKIAAGEVVERPASVVKELCENSVDAGARSLTVTLSGGGMSRISVLDDGVGMSREDVLLSLVRHATSKLKDLDGLFQIATKGFRGEALPAIAAVSRFSLTTSERGAPVGTKLSLEGGSPPLVEDAAPIDGTLIQVDDLFYNTPARRKFMRRDHTEVAHCEDALIRLALAHPELSVRLTHEDKVLLSSAASTDLRERIVAALGVAVHPHLVEVDERRLGLQITGYVATPAYTLSNARGVYTFVNRRYIRDRGLNHALGRAFQETMPGGRQPVAVLFIDMDPREVDVNVHPQKLEVRFADGRGIHEAVVAGVSHAITRWFKSAAPAAPTGEPVAGAHYADAVDRFLTRAEANRGGGATFIPLPGVADAPRAEGLFGAAFPPAAGEGRAGFGQLRPSLNQAPPPGYFSSLRLLGMLGRRFLVCEGAGGSLVVVDPHAALERARLEALRALWKNGADPAQRTLFGATVELTAAQARVLGAQSEGLERLGIEAEPFGGSAFAVKALPAVLNEVEPAALLSALAGALGESEEPAWDAALQAAACLSARTALREISAVEARALFDALEKADFERPVRHDQIVLTELPFLDLERRVR